LRFCNSGTEANLFAISTARAFTGRSKIMVFNGGYHGGVFYFGQVKPPINAPFPWVIAPYNDTQATVELIDANASDLASVVIEPMLGGGGCIPADLSFLRAIREACSRHGILLHFDEVMTSRLAPGGLQGKLGVRPDMTALGKYLGGGMTFGAFGGRAEIMERFNPYRAGSIAHAGTFNNNVLSMAAGLTGLRDIYTAAESERLNATGDRLRDRLNEAAQQRGLPVQVTGAGSMLCIHFRGGAIRRPEDVWATGYEAELLERLKALFHLDMMAAGQYLARRGFMSLSLPMTNIEHDGLVRAFEEFLETRGGLLM
jgi:glutamate-1-semialdehyde 2,1-aminomutase